LPTLWVTSWDPAGEGGRIEPSWAKVGSPRGLVVPGIAALERFTSVPLMP
jgi:hypothetical protein